MADISTQDMAEKLLSGGFAHSGLVATALSDPIVDTHMVVTLDELHPYELDPRLTRNPRYDEIKASIRERGLDAPPPITRRPGAAHYIIRNGGNTRLAILRELWSESKDERFFRIGCLFRPWPERGEIVALTGHLAENELHGGLSFIERALGVEKARELYEQDLGKPLSQSELARRLKSDGYPVPQPHISRMQEAIQYLLPAIPSVLYGGLGRHQIEQLTSLRRAGLRIWEARSATSRAVLDFPSLFQEVLVPFDTAVGAFSVPRVQDELLGQMADLLGVQYDTLAIEIIEAENRWQLLTSEPEPQVPATPPQAPVAPVAPPLITSPASESHTELSSPPRQNSGPGKSPPGIRSTAVSDNPPLQQDGPTERTHTAPLDQHLVTPVETSDRLQSIQRLVAEHLGETPPKFEHNVLTTIPVQVGGLYPITDVWYIEPALDEPDRLRRNIAQFAREIAEEAGQSDAVSPCDFGLGFCCSPSAPGETATTSAFARAVLMLLGVLSAPYQRSPNNQISSDAGQLANDLAPLLQGGELIRTPQEQPARISDAGLVKLFRLVRLARRLFDLEAGASSTGGVDAMPEP
ncbi:ParB family protein [Pseudomonas chlororaphis]|uniref:ParB family protein n=1 Tax=Pseudomonas chlororaphis TaxID=587753 RepID=UPI00047149F2|nr:ParB family protein [Pseudomonas chlororaphis]